MERAQRQKQHTEQHHWGSRCVWAIGLGALWAALGWLLIPPVLFLVVEAFHVEIGDRAVLRNFALAGASVGGLIGGMLGWWVSSKDRFERASIGTYGLKGALIGGALGGLVGGVLGMLVGHDLLAFLAALQGFAAAGAGAGSLAGGRVGVKAAARRKALLSGGLEHAPAPEGMVPAELSESRSGRSLRVAAILAAVAVGMSVVFRLLGRTLPHEQWLPLILVLLLIVYLGDRWERRLRQ